MDAPVHKFICPGCRMFCGLIHNGPRLPLAPDCRTPNCAAILALDPDHNRLDTVAQQIIADHVEARRLENNC